MWTPGKDKCVVPEAVAWPVCSGELEESVLEDGERGGGERLLRSGHVALRATARSYILLSDGKSLGCHVHLKTSFWLQCGELTLQLRKEKWKLWNSIGTVVIMQLREMVTRLRVSAFQPWLTLKELLKNTKAYTKPRVTDKNICRWDQALFILNLPRWFQCAAKVENHCPR